MEQNIGKANKAFMKANKVRRRVLIAKDVIQQIRVRKYRMSPGVYFALRGAESSDINQKTVNEAHSCTVCGIGGVFCSVLRLANDFNIKPLHLGGEIEDARRYMHKYFSSQQLNLIECAFEGWESHNRNGWNIPTSEFHDQHPDETERAIAIFQNIIDNKGKFVCE